MIFLLNIDAFPSVLFALKVKSCVTAFHVTCGFKQGLEMRTVLDDNATDGVRHIVSTLSFNIRSLTSLLTHFCIILIQSYCTKHSHKSRSPSKKTKEEEKGTTSAEDAENLRQKR